MFLFTPAILTITRPIESFSHKLTQASKAAVRPNNYIAAIAAIAAIRATKGNIFLLPEAYCPSSPIARFTVISTLSNIFNIITLINYTIKRGT